MAGAAALEDLYRRHHANLVCGLQRRFGVGREQAEDAMAFAWLQLARREDELVGNVAGWLYTVAKHELWAQLRIARRATGIDAPEQAVEYDLVEALEAGRIAALMAQLKPQQRLVLRLRAQGWSYSQIAAITGRSYTWVNRHISEGRAALRRLAAD